MSKLIEKEGQFYKECGVVMLESNKESRLYLRDGILCRSSIAYKQESFPNQQNQHLYITSDDEIKDGDWYLGIDNRICIAVKNNAKGMLKIIASTDSLLPLPQPSDKFIQAYIDAYNKGEKIEKVLVEYEFGNISESYFYGEVEKLPLKLKLKDNNIIIKKVKDSWSKEEVKKLINAALIEFEASTFSEANQTIQKWIEENL